MQEYFVIFAYDDYNKYVGQQILRVVKSEQLARSLIAPLLHPAFRSEQEYVEIKGDVFDQEMIPGDYYSFYYILLQFHKEGSEEHNILRNLTEEQYNQHRKEYIERLEKAKKDLGLDKWYHRIAISKVPFHDE